VLDGTGEGDYAPLFTYHGFRYIYISSDKGEVRAEGAKARLIAEAENLMMTDKIWDEEPRKISTGPLADAEIFDRSKG